MPGKVTTTARVELADVDAELERVGRDHRAQLAARQPSLELAALLGGVAGAVGRRRARPARGPRREVVADEPAQQLDALARLHEADRARALAHEPGEQLGRLAERRAPRAERLVGQRRVPHRDLPLGRGRAVASISANVLEAGQALGQLDRVGDRRRGQQEARLGAVRGGDPRAAGAARWPRASRTRRGRRAPRRPRRPQVGEQVGPGGVVGQDADVQHVGVGEHDVGAACGSPRAPRAACRRRRSPGAPASRGRRRPARAPGPARAPWSGRGRAPAPSAAAEAPAASAG